MITGITTARTHGGQFVSVFNEDTPWPKQQEAFKEEKVKAASNGRTHLDYAQMTLIRIESSQSSSCMAEVQRLNFTQPIKQSRKK